MHMGAPATFVRGLGSRNFCEYVWHKYSATRSASMGLGSCKFCEYARQEYSATRSAPRAHRGHHLQGVIVAHLQGQFQITPSDRGNCGTPAGPNPGSPPSDEGSAAGVIVASLEWGRVSSAAGERVRGNWGNWG